MLGRVLAEVAAERSKRPLRSFSPRRVAAVFAQHAIDLGRVLIRGGDRGLGRVLARVADVCTAIARASRPRGGARMLSP
jgi:hypothetical protein